MLSFMRKLLVVASLVSAVALAAGGMSFDTTVQTTFTNCPSGGVATSNLAAGTNYYVTVTDQDTFICLDGTTCASGGVKVPMGGQFVMSTGGIIGASCRSSGSLGDVQFTKIRD